jgi:2-dehydropantoate 2-reductase
MKANQFKIVVVGAGAVGSYFGGLLARAQQDVTLIGRSDHVRAIQEKGLYMDCQSFQEYVAIKASTDYSALTQADLVLFCVKSPDTHSVMAEIKPFLRKDAMVLSLQNGVDNCDRIKNHFSGYVYPAVVYVATGMLGPGHVKHFGRGELVVGALDLAAEADQNNLMKIATVFNESQIPCTIADKIKDQMWMKFLVNCSFNGISAIGDIQYGKMVQVPAINHLINQITQEFLLIAAKEGVNIETEKAEMANQQIALTMAGQKSSTAQDVGKKRKTEIEHLNGLIIRLGEKYQIPTPANQSVYALVKMLEANYTAR